MNTDLGGRVAADAPAEAAILNLEEILQEGDSSSIWSRLGKLFGRDDEESLEKAIQEAGADGEVDPEEESMLLNILRFDKLQVQDIMTPRTDIDCLAKGGTLMDAVELIISSGHSRIPVFLDTRDNIVGVLHAKDLLPYLIDPEKHDTPVDALMRETFFVPETKNVFDLLQEFRCRKIHIAIALDEYGGTSGLVTIEDVIEEIVGDIEDEHDAPREEDIRVLSEGRFELSGRAFLDDLRELGIDFASDEVDTIGGYLTLRAGHVPESGESFILDKWKFTVEEADVKAIRRISVEPAQAEE